MAILASEIDSASTEENGMLTLYANSTGCCETSCVGLDCRRICLDFNCSVTSINLTLMDMIFARALHADFSTCGLSANDRALVTRSSIVPLSCTVCVTVTVSVVIVCVIVCVTVVAEVVEVMLMVLRLEDDELILLVLREVELNVLVRLVCVPSLEDIFSLEALLEVMLKELKGDVM